MKLIFFVVLSILISDNIFQVKSNVEESNHKYNCQFLVSQQFVDAFREFYMNVNHDANGDLSTEEIWNFFNHFDDEQYHIKKPKAEELRKLCDKGKDGKVSEEEWIRFWVNRFIENVQEDVDEDFKTFDQDGDQFVSEGELEAMFIKMGEKKEVARRTAEVIINTVDCHGHDRKLSKDEFMGIVTARHGLKEG